jgi:asparagine synthase (glutamine-hydrolysing)
MSTLKPLSLTDGLLGREFVSRVDGSLASRKQSHPLTATVFEEIPSHLFGPLATARSQLTFRTPYLDNSLVKLAYQAPYSSRQTPAAALNLIAYGHEKLGKTPTDLGFSCGRQSPLDSARKLFCKISFKLDYLDKEGLPPNLAMLDSCRPLLERLGVLGLHKFLPYRRWFKVELVDIVERATMRAANGSQPWWSPQVAARIAADHSSGRCNHLREINAILTLDSIERVLIENPTGRAADDDGRQGI